jgi:hypothetical protein
MNLENGLKNMMIPKFDYFRNKKHLQNVASLPCQNCYVEGQTQAAHSNWAEHGKGRGIRASDEFTAALCIGCHREIDSEPTLNKEQRRYIWDMAHRRTINRLIEQGLWPSELQIR